MYTLEFASDLETDPSPLWASISPYDPENLYQIIPEALSSLPFSSSFLSAIVSLSPVGDFLPPSGLFWISSPWQASCALC